MIMNYESVTKRYIRKTTNKNTRQRRGNDAKVTKESNADRREKNMKRGNK